MPMIALMVAAVLAGSSAGTAPGRGGPPARDALFVDGGAAPGGDGTIDRPFRTVAAALEPGRGGREIRIAAGRYTENVGSPDDYQDRQVVLRGGYSPASRFTVRDPARFPTVVIAADAARPVFQLDNADSIVLDGIQIRGGAQGIRAMGWRTGRRITVTNCVITANGNRKHPADGAGAQLQAKSITFNRNRVEGNTGGHLGGAVVIEHPDGERGAGALLRGNVIRNNVAVGSGIHGAGIWLASSGRFEKNVVDGNTMASTDHSGPGGGLIVVGEGVRVTISRSLFVNNRAETAGAGVFVDEGATALLENDVIAGNRAGQGGSGVAVDGGAGIRGSLRIVNCTITGNGPKDSTVGEGLAVGNSDAEVVNSIFWANGADDLEIEPDGKLAISCSNFTGKTGPNVKRGAGLQEADPGFVGASKGNYALGPKSPMLRAGCPGAGPAVDFLGRARRAGPPDLGAYAGEAGR